jgi:putative ABC transport system permease protein
MLNNYIKIALRNIQRNKIHTIINIIGLALGMACTALALIYVWDMLSYDRHNSKHERIYLIQSHFRLNDRETLDNGTFFAIGPTLKDEYPAIEEYVRIYWSNRMSFTDRKKEIIGENAVCYADPQIFKVFDHNFVNGSPEGALDTPHNIVLSESLAKKYFGENDPVGKVLSRNNGTDYTVTGVFEDLPRNTFRRYTALIPMMDITEIYSANQINSRDSCAFFSSTTRLFTYILLRKNSKIESITNDYERFRKKYLAECAARLDRDFKPVFQPLTDVNLHFKPSLDSPPYTLVGVYVLSASAFLIMLISCINYMNLATASSAGRAREVGVRKVLGASKVSLVRQFLCESIIITMISLLFTFMMVELLFPIFNYGAYKERALNMILDPAAFAGIIIVALTVGLIAGSYPAFFLSSFLPAKVIKGDIKHGRGGEKLRKFLVGLQITCSISAITISIINQDQVDFMKQMDIGFNKDNVLIIIPSDSEAIESLPAFKKELFGNSQILRVGQSNTTAGISGVNNWINRIENSEGELVEKTISTGLVDYDFINLMGMEIMDGRSFNREMGSDQAEAFLVNETLVKEMGWTDSPVGKRIQLPWFNNYTRDGKVIGVLKDFYFLNLKTRLQPMILLLNENKALGEMPVLSIKLRDGYSKKTIEFIKKKWLDLNPMQPFEYIFLDEIINSQYQGDEDFAQKINYFAFISIFISCLGLFGLSSFVAEKKNKEVGIRKVNGASIWDIYFHLSYDFVRIVLKSGIVSLFIIFPALIVISDLYPYKPEGFPWGFVIAVLLTLGITIITISYHAIKAALTNPVKALRYE